MTARVITDPSALGWVLDPDTGRWEWSGSGDGGGSGGGGGAWELIETVNIAGASTVEFSDFSLEIPRYKVVWTASKGFDEIKSLRMRVMVDGVAQTSGHRSNAYFGDSNTSPTHGPQSDSNSSGSFIELAGYNGGTGFRKAVFHGEIDLFTPDPSKTPADDLFMQVSSKFFCHGKEYRHAGDFYIGNSSTPKNIDGIHLYASPLFEVGTVHLFGLNV